MAGQSMRAAAAGGHSVETAFYKEQATRLQVELARLQRSAAAEPTGTAADPPPWSLDSVALPPLIRSYDERIAELERNAAKESERASAAESHLRAVEAHNTRLSNELETALEASLRHEALIASRATSGICGTAPITEESEELRARLAVLAEENELLVEEHTLALSELRRLQQESIERSGEGLKRDKALGESLEKLARCEAERDDEIDSHQRSKVALRRAAAELLLAREHEATATSLADRKAREADAARRSLAEAQEALGEGTDGWSAERDALLDARRAASSHEAAMEAQLERVRAALKQEQIRKPRSESPDLLHQPHTQSPPHSPRACSPPHSSHPAAPHLSPPSSHPNSTSSPLPPPHTAARASNAPSARSRCCVPS